ncbi:hypothetical protein [Pseudomonas sp. MWU13-2105]|uniref:hypothetical protein n=1 Tax=Pseudomonas sp. MWU13-2105 TaxID=2935074 RepID=UPI0020104C45|nr:hypothetical protein [Pseudomonas sp. MWU13-2105]
MKPTDSVIDLSQYRKRKQAQKLARVLWEVYARNAGQQIFQWPQLTRTSETRQA